MTDDEMNAALQRRMESMLADSIAAGEMGSNSRMAGPWVFICETYAEDGSRLISQYTNDDNRLSEALGLATFAQALYVEAVKDWYAEGRDG